MFMIILLIIRTHVERADYQAMYMVFNKYERPLFLFFGILNDDNP